MKVDAEALIAWINLNKVEDGVVTPPPPIVYVCPTCGLQFTSQAALDAHVISAHTAPPPPPPPPTGEQGSKGNPFKMNVPYSKVMNGFIAERKGYSFSIGASKLYVEVDPNVIKPGSKSFRLYVKPMNCPTLAVYRAYYDKLTNSVTDDVKIGTMDTVSTSPARPFASTKFLYALENTGEAWTIESWVQVG
jgi:hypothetical protein